jgi:hypothetical protein
MDRLVKTVYWFCCILCLLTAGVGCSRSANGSGEGDQPTNQTNTATDIKLNANDDWHPDTKDLDLTAREEPEFLSLDRDVKNFYELLHNKDWKATYALRWQAFRRVVSEQIYISGCEQELPKWELTDYDILSVHMYNSDDAIVVCRFIEMPGPTTTYSVVDWRKEKDGVWRCDAAGPGLMRMFQSFNYEKKPDDGN